MQSTGKRAARHRRNRRLWVRTLVLIRSGVTINRAIRATGITRPTFFRWLARERDLADAMRSLTD